MRMWEELMFRDYKSHGWQWHKSRVWDPARANVLWLVMSLAHVWMLSLGATVCRSPDLRKRVIGRKWKVTSVFRQGLAMFQRCLLAGETIPCALSLPTNLRAAGKV